MKQAYTWTKREHALEIAAMIAVRSDNERTLPTMKEGDWEK